MVIAHRYTLQSGSKQSGKSVNLSAPMKPKTLCIAGINQCAVRQRYFKSKRRQALGRETEFGPRDSESSLRWRIDILEVSNCFSGNSGIVSAKAPAVRVQPTYM